MDQSTNTLHDISNAERIGKAVAEVAKRIRIQDFDVVGIQGTTYGAAAKVTVSVHLETRRDLYKAASYFQLTKSHDTAGGVTIYDASSVTGLHDAVVEAFGPASDEDAAVSA